MSRCKNIITCLNDSKEIDFLFLIYDRLDKLPVIKETVELPVMGIRKNRFHIDKGLRFYLAEDADGYIHRLQQDSLPEPGLSFMKIKIREKPVAAGFEQGVQHPEYLYGLSGGEIIEEEGGQDTIVSLFCCKLLDG